MANDTFSHFPLKARLTFETEISSSFKASSFKKITNSKLVEHVLNMLRRKIKISRNFADCVYTLQVNIYLAILQYLRILELSLRVASASESGNETTKQNEKAKKVTSLAKTNSFHRPIKYKTMQLILKINCIRIDKLFTQPSKIVPRRLLQLLNLPESV